MPSTRSLLVVLLATPVLFVGCSSGSGGAARQRSVMLTVAAAPGTNYTAANAITVGGGSLTLQTALFAVERVEIEENTGEENGGGGEQGEHEDGENEGNEGNEQETEEIELPGPFLLDVTSSPVVLGSVQVFPGTFRQADMHFRLESAPPLAGDSIYITGTFAATGGATTPFRLASRFLGGIEAPIANGGITVTANTVVSISLTFDLAALLGNLDFATAVVESGEIVIDDTHNPALLAAFEQNLGGCVELEEHEHEGEEHR